MIRQKTAFTLPQQAAKKEEKMDIKERLNKRLSNVGSKQWFFFVLPNFGSVR